MNSKEQRAFYPTAQALAAMGATLQRDVVLWSARLAREYGKPYAAPVYTRSERNDPPIPERPRRDYQSRYIGVSQRYTGYCGHWAPEPGKYVRGPVRATEEEAARDRAQALGLDYVEVRP